MLLETWVIERPKGYKYSLIVFVVVLMTRDIKEWEYVYILIVMI